MCDKLIRLREEYSADPQDAIKHLETQEAAKASSCIA